VAGETVRGKCANVEAQGDRGGDHRGGGATDAQWREKSVRCAGENTGIEDVGDTVSEGLEVWQGIWGDIATQRATLKRASDRLREFRLTSGRRQWGQDPANDPGSGVGRVAARPADRVFQNQRLMALGNMVVPQVAQFLGEMILGLAKR